MRSRYYALAIIGVTLLGSAAHARGVYLQVFERDSQGKLRFKHMLERTPCVRCSTTVQAKINRGGDTLASCRNTGPRGSCRPSCAAFSTDDASGAAAGEILD
jgi:hypothetical protein